MPTAFQKYCCPIDQKRDKGSEEACFHSCTENNVNWKDEDIFHSCGVDLSLMLMWEIREQHLYSSDAALWSLTSNLLLSYSLVVSWVFCFTQVLYNRPVLACLIPFLQKVCQSLAWHPSLLPTAMTIVTIIATSRTFSVLDSVLPISYPCLGVWEWGLPVGIYYYNNNNNHFILPN